ncbi:OpgC domain-containing protein [Rhodobacteraceae bacterium NNCM2]|nr:OpgC domain-containing protein [Coraliihabitans acroporae]
MNRPDFIPAAPAVKPQRDLRLDFFRGLAMFVILLAHTPGNTWTLWIPARFGFSDATEIFVFCSGMASAMAFGTVFLKKSWFLGTARIAFRVWQVYWAHICVVLTTAILMVLLDHTGMGEEGRSYADWPSVARFFTHTKEWMLGLVTLTFVPGLMDILPMYLVILAMVPGVMLLYQFGGKQAVFAFVILLWLAAQLAGYARMSDEIAEPSGFQRWLLAFSQQFTFLNLPANPWSENAQWFFNPFGWQIVFFTGFAFGTGWLPAPPVRRGLVLLAIGFILITMPFAWHKMHGTWGYVPEDSALRLWLSDTRDFITPMWWKTGVGFLRYVHFLAIAYLAWVVVGPGGARLRDGWRAVMRTTRSRRTICIAMVPIILVTVPYAYIEEIMAYMPSLNDWIMSSYPLIDGAQLGMVQILHLVALAALVWNMIGDEARQWVIRDAFLAAVPVIRKVGTQSLAVFMVSIVLSRFNGWWLDVIGRDVWTTALVNFTGFGILIATAYLVSWFKRQPWREDRKRRETAIATPARGSASGHPSEQAARAIQA